MQICAVRRTFRIMRTHSVASVSADVDTRSGCTTFPSSMLLTAPLRTSMPAAVSPCAPAAHEDADGSPVSRESGSFGLVPLHTLRISISHAQKHKSKLVTSRGREGAQRRDSHAHTKACAFCH